MQPAMLTLNEPHAWLIRGLVEYGWKDITGRGGVVPPGAVGGFDVSRLPGSGGKDGLTLVMAPEADGRRAEDPNYEFEVKITGRAPDIKVVARCSDCNFLEEYPYDLKNPSHAAGYLHQGLTRHVPEFVRWRLSGGELTWSQRAGVPEVQGDPCSGDMIRFVQIRLRTPNTSFEQGPAEGWWLSGDYKPWGSGPVAREGEGAGEPVYISAEGRAELAEMGGAGASVERVAALDYVDGVAGWLSIAIWFCMALGVLAFINSVVTLYFFGTGRITALAINVVLGAGVLGGGVLARQGLRRYREVREHWSVYFLLAYVALTPACCVVGFPLAGWGLYTWMRPEVRAGRIRG